MFTLGLSGLAHDPAAALLGDSGVLAAIEESKLIRSRTASGIPREAIAYVLERAGIAWNDLGRVAVASKPIEAWAREAWLRARVMPFAPLSSGYYEAKAFGYLAASLAFACL